MRVIIIGAGTGGMCLAHGLTRAGIDIAVYERHRTRTDGLLGYRVGIDPTGNRALRDCLPPELFETFVATCARTPQHFNAYTQDLKRLLSVELQESDDPIHTERSVSRMTLRQVLLTGMEDVVHFDKTFTHYEQHDDSVTVYFSDGSSDTADVLVGADGTRSAVREQYLPYARIEDAGVVSLTTKVAIDSETRALLPKEAFDGLSLIFGTRGTLGIVHVMEFQWDQDGTAKVGGSDAELLKRWPGLLYDNTRDYINIAMWTSADRFPANVGELRGPEVIELALEMTPHWHPNLRRLFELGDPASSFPVVTATSVPIEPWRTTNITLLGDAIHTMTPGHGVGANTALRDAALLCRRLAAGGDLLDGIGAYEAEMIPYGFARVHDSLHNNGTSGNDPLYKPFAGRLAMAGARTYFRAVDKIPAVRRKFVDDLTTYRES